MSMARTIAILGAGLGGYEAGQEAKRKREMQDEDRAWTRKNRERQEEQWRRDDAKWQREEAERASMESAAKPVEAKPELLPDQQGPQTYSVAGKTIADPVQADKAVADANSVHGTLRRMGAAATNPMTRLQMEERARAAEAQDILRNQLIAKDVERRFGDDIKSAFQSWEGGLQFMNDSKADGQGGAMKFAMKRDQGKVRIYRVGPDGTALDDGAEFEDSPNGRAIASFILNKYTSEKDKIKHYAEEKKAKQEEENRVRDDKRAEARDKADAEYRAGMLRAAQAKAPQAPTPTWDPEADKVLRDRYTFNDPNTGVAKTDSDGFLFAQAVALAAARHNGGNWSAAIETAHRDDQALQAAAALRAKSSGRPVEQELRAMRAAQLERLFATPKPMAPPQPAAGSAPATTKPAPASRAAAPTDPLAGMTREQARTKRAELVSELDRWKGKANAQGIVAEIQGLIDRIDSGQF